MKKIALLCICSFLVLTGCASNKAGVVKDISVTQVAEMIEKKETFHLIVSLDTCPHCQDLKAMLKENIKKHDVTIYRVELKSDAQEKLYQDLDVLKKYLSNPSSIPHMYSIEKGKEKDQHEGYDIKNPDEFWDFIEKN